MSTTHDRYLLPPVPEAQCLFISIARQEDAVVVILLTAFLAAAGWPLCDQNAGHDGPLI